MFSQHTCPVTFRLDWRFSLAARTVETKLITPSCWQLFHLKIISLVWWWTKQERWNKIDSMDCECNVCSLSVLVMSCPVFRCRWLKLILAAFRDKSHPDGKLGYNTENRRDVSDTASFFVTIVDLLIQQNCEDGAWHEPRWILLVNFVLNTWCIFQKPSLFNRQLQNAYSLYVCVSWAESL